MIFDEIVKLKNEMDVAELNWERLDDDINDAYFDVVSEIKAAAAEAEVVFNLAKQKFDEACGKLITQIMETR